MRTAVCLIAAGLVGGALFGPPPPAPAAQADPRPYAVGPMPGATAGGLSCAAASCHGGGRPGERFSEHSTWAADLTRNPPVPHDPHANAYRVLFNADSVRIANLVGGGPAHTNARCLVCHAVPGATDGAVSEGVGCAGCHGSEQRWLTVHYLPEWKALSNRDKASHGFVPTKNLVARASACAGCHVGDSSRDVDHDLIAAGHPRLNFEMARFHNTQMYRKHWTDPAGETGFEARAWAVGQLASLRAALDLLAARATRASTPAATHPWPEFSEGSCYACHQTVTRDPFPKSAIEGPRSLQRDPGADFARRPGAIPWQPWYTSVATDPAVRGVLGVTGAPTDLRELRAEMERRTPDARKVADLAARARAALDQYLAAVQEAEDRGGLAPVTPDSLRGLAATLADGALGESGRLKDYDWDFVAQRYLGVAMAYHAGGGSTGPAAPWRGPLLQLRDALAFPPAGAVRYDSPVTYRPDAAAAPLGALRTITRSGR